MRCFLRIKFPNGSEYALPLPMSHTSDSYLFLSDWDVRRIKELCDVKAKENEQKVLEEKLH